MSVVLNAWHLRGKLSMAGRVTLSLLIVFCCLRTERAFPQDNTAVFGAVPGGDQAQPWIKPAEFSSAPQEYGGFSGGSPLNDGGGLRDITPTTPRQPMQYATARTAEPGVGYAAGPGFVTTHVGDDQDEIELTPLEKLIQQSMHRMWFRLEYLNWSLSKPKTRLLGGQTLLTRDPAVLFGVPGGPVPSSIARVLTLNAVNFQDNNGIRGTFGIPFDSVVLEFSGFAIDQASDRVTADELPQVGTGRFVATTFTVNGAPSSATPRLFDKSFTARYASSLWGAGGNIVFNTDSTPGEGLKIRPVLGFQYIALKEQLTQIGVFNNGQSIADQTSVIDAQTHNRIYGPNLGLRVELEHRWFTFGVSPNLLLAANSLQTAVASNHFLGPNDPLRQTEIDDTIFTAGFQVGVYGRIHVTENFSMHVGWDFLWLSQVARPEGSIRYDVNGVGGVPTTSAISAKRDLNDFRAQGLSVGGEIRF